MIFYTISGPTTNLEIRDDQLIVKSKGPFSWLHKKESDVTIPLNQIRQFMVTRNLLMGKIVISNGEQTYQMSFTSPYKMVQMIEKYMQKRILKNIQAIAPQVVSLQDYRQSKKEAEETVKIASPNVAA